MPSALTHNPLHSTLRLLPSALYPLPATLTRNPPSTLCANPQPSEHKPLLPSARNHRSCHPRPHAEMSERFTFRFGHVSWYTFRIVAGVSSRCLAYSDTRLVQLSDVDIRRISSCPLHPSTLNPQTSTLNPQPSALKPQPSTLNPQPSTLNPQPSTLNTQLSTLKPQTSTLRPQPSTPNLQPSILNPQPSTLNPQPSTLNPRPPTLNSGVACPSAQDLQQVLCAAAPAPCTLHPAPCTLNPEPFPSAQDLQQTLSMALHISGLEVTMGNSDHSTPYTYTASRVD